jgi:hypothetical protein
VRATLTLAGMRDTSLRYTHGVVVLLQSWARPLERPILVTAVRVDGGVYREMRPTVSQRATDGAAAAPGR